MSLALCCSDLTWPSLLNRASASSRRLVGTRRTNEAVECPSPVETCEDCTNPPDACVARTTPSLAAWTSVVVSSRRVLRSTRRWRVGVDPPGGTAGAAGAAPVAFPPLALPLAPRPAPAVLLFAESWDLSCVATAAGELPPPLLALSLGPPPALSTTATTAA